jgi:PAS domain S-box-containing protein
MITERDMQDHGDMHHSLRHYGDAVMALNNAAIAITGSLQVEEILFRLITSAEEIFPQAFAITVQLLDEDGTTMQTVYASPSAIKTTNKVVFRPNVGVAGHAIAEGKVINIGDVNADSRFIPGAFEPAFHSLLVAPMVTASRIWGALSIEGEEIGVFAEQDEILANLLARQVAVAIENAHLYESEQKQRQIAETLRDIGLVLAGTLRQETVLARVLEQVVRVLPYDAAAVWLAQDDGSYRRLIGLGYERFGIPEEKQITVWRPDDRPIFRKVAETGQVLIVPDVDNEPEWLFADVCAWLHSWAGAPIQVRGQLIGVFCLDHTRAGFYGPQHVPILEALAAQVSIAVENAILFEEIQGYAIGLQRKVIARSLEVQIQQERLEAILRNIEDVVVIADLESRILYVNEAFHRLLGWGEQSVLDQPLRSFVYDVGSDHALQIIVQAVRHLQPWRGEIVMLHRDGYSVSVETSSVPYRDPDGNVIGFIASFRRLDETQVIDRMKGQFMNLISHELRTPLTNLRLHLHLLRRLEEDPDRRKAHIAALDAQVEQMVQLMEKILSVTRLADADAFRAGCLINLPSLLDNVRVRFAETAARKTIDLAIRPLPEVLPELYGDEQWLTKACYELAENALAYTPPGGKVTVELAPFQQNQRNYWGVFVRDTGPGISAEDITRLNAPFIRVGLQEVGTTAGMGLGLFITRSVAERHGGGLHVESTPGEGSAFVLYLPARE